ncbi:retinol dehydrogenase 13-like [Contarinia nasturtii]|uniref:retinol dehydrogenase 13-like n=1 Tax=Contarinia nasturtii TaxID=265458 RepID=UPI0012D42AAF|nr:retinol dehydrogenase 13-like [Contarinia nasturtii]
MAEINYWYFGIPAASIAVIYIIRRIRVWQWGRISDRYSLEGKTFIVTGANTGLGFETTKALIKRDAIVIMACRSISRAEEAMKKIQKETSKGRMIPLHLDLASFESIYDFVQNIKTNYPTFNCLINNAGLAMPDSKKKTDDGIELHFGTNHIGHFLLTRLLQDRIKTNRARVVIVSSLLHEKGEINFNTIGKVVEETEASSISRTNNPFYNNSKLANFYHARELFKSGYDAHVLCPGLCHTDFFRDYNPRWYHYVIFSPIVWLLLRSAEQGAENIVYCATANQNTDEKNPATGYFVRNLKQTKSKVKFDDQIGARLWKESEIICSSILVREERKNERQYQVRNVHTDRKKDDFLLDMLRQCQDAGIGLKMN